MKKDKEYIIWSSLIDLDEWDADEELQRAYELNNMYLDDERVNLNIPLDDPILVIADLGLWNGRKSGYKEIGSNVADCLCSDTDDATWYIDKLGDLRCTASHHDGTNYYTYRVYKSGVSDERRENLKAKIYDGTATRQDITAVTKRLGDYVQQAYGFKKFWR